MARIAVAGATGRVGRHVVDVLEADGHEVVAISRSHGVDVITGDGLAAALDGVECVIDTATGPSPEQAAATEFFTTAARNLQEVGSQAGVRRIVVVSIIGTDKFTGGYGAAKLAHEQAALAGPVPARILRAAQFHEFVEQLIAWGRQGEVSYLPRCAPSWSPPGQSPRRSPTWPPRRSRPRGRAVPEIAGPREENLVGHSDAARGRRGDAVKIEARQRPGGPGRRAQLERRPAAGPGRHPRRPDLRGVAGRHALTRHREARVPQTRPR